jgi:hypothetical protein
MAEWLWREIEKEKISGHQPTAFGEKSKSSQNLYENMNFMKLYENMNANNAVLYVKPRYVRVIVRHKVCSNK